MDTELSAHFNDLASTDNNTRKEALQTLLDQTDHKVDWVYEVWDRLLEKLDHENSFQRSIGIMLLCNLAKSDHEDRLSASLDRLLEHTKDEKFITSRQCIQNIWKIGLTNDASLARVVDHLETRFDECVDEEHYNLLRLDIIQSLKNLSIGKADETLVDQAQALIAKEKEEKYRKKYVTILS